MVYFAVTCLAVIDRFTTNVSPRQSFADSWEVCRKDDGSGGYKSGCGNDFMCDDYWCLKPGPLSLKVFDVLSRTSGRVIITTTALLFLTMCHSLSNALATTPFFLAHPSLLYNSKNDNLYLHSLGGKIVGLCTVVHVWSLMLPSLIDGWSNVIIHPNTPEASFETLSLPLQISLGTKQTALDVTETRWGYDDLWRLFWMTLMFLVLFPLSRSARHLLAHNYNLAMSLHVALGLGYFFDSFRRRSHPHVWLYNTPALLLYIGDRAVAASVYLYSPNTVTKIYTLDENYVVVAWNSVHDHVDTVCDIFRMKSTIAPFTEWYHSYTTASNRGSSLEVPVRADDTRWLGHKFRVLDDEREGFREEGRHGVQRFTVGQSQRELNLVKVYDPYPDSPSGPSSPGASARFRTSTLIEPKRTIDRSDEVVLGGGAVERPVRPVHKMQKQRTSVFSLFRKKNQPSTSSSSFTNLAVVRVHQNGATEKWVAVANPTTDRAQKQRKGRINMNICGGYQSEYSLLATLIGKCPLLIVATGAGAGLVLDVVSYIKGKNVAIAAENHVDIVFSTWSLPLLQFVTNNVLSVDVDNVSLTCALTRMGDVELDDEKGRGGLGFSRIDLASTVQGVADDNQQVFFCGSGEVSKRLKALCGGRGLHFTGAAVEN